MQVVSDVHLNVHFSTYTVCMRMVMNTSNTTLAA